MWGCAIELEARISHSAHNNLRNVWSGVVKTVSICTCASREMFVREGQVRLPTCAGVQQLYALSVPRLRSGAASWGSCT